MRFFGQNTASSVGLIWDLRKLDTSRAYMWPSGYHAKTEFNVDADGNMKNGRREALVTLEQLRQANATHDFQDGEVMNYNEVLIHVTGVQGLIGILSRTTCIKNLLLAMGIQAKLLQSLPAAGELPIFVHDPDLGLRPFGKAAQSRLLCEQLVPAPLPPPSSYGPVFPLNTQSLGLHPLHQLEVHGAYGVTADALHGIVGSLLHGDAGDHRHEQEVRAILVCGLQAAVASDNRSSALALVQELAPLLITGARMPDRGGLVLNLKTDNALQPPRAVVDFTAHLDGLAAKAKSPGMLVMVGTTILLNELVSGRMMSRVDEACRHLEGWLHEAGSLVFRLKSWRELTTRRKPSQIISFVTKKAIRNRANFRSALAEVEGCQHDALSCMTKLHNLVVELRNPCLRLELLQRIYGLNEQYDIQAVLDVATTAMRLLQAVGGLQHMGAAETISKGTAVKAALASAAKGMGDAPGGEDPPGLRGLASGAADRSNPACSGRGAWTSMAARRFAACLPCA